jgi:glucan phosphorylase
MTTAPAPQYEDNRTGLSVETLKRVCIDLSAQMATVGKEASGTGNRKLAMNEAVIIGPLDGANVEIREKAGAENFFLFGLNAQAVMALRAHGYRPWEYDNHNPVLKEVQSFQRFWGMGELSIHRWKGFELYPVINKKTVIDQIAGGMFWREDTEG